MSRFTAHVILLILILIVLSTCYALTSCAMTGIHREYDTDGITMEDISSRGLLTTRSGIITVDRSSKDGIAKTEERDLATSDYKETPDTAMATELMDVLKRYTVPVP